MATRIHNGMRLAGLFAVIVAIVIAAFWVDQSQWVALGHWLEGNRSIAAVGLIGGHILAASLMLPSWVFIAMAGYLFGVPLGLGLGYLSTLTASTIVFGIGRTLGRGWVQRRLHDLRILNALDSAVTNNGLLIVTLSRLSLLFPLSLLNYAYALTGVRFGHYILGSAVGLIPAVLVYGILGASVEDITGLVTGNYRNPGWLLWVSLVVAIGVTWWVARLTHEILKQHLDNARPEVDLVEDDQ